MRAGEAGTFVANEDRKKTKEQLIAELADLRHRLSYEAPPDALSPEDMRSDAVNGTDTSVSAHPSARATPRRTDRQQRTLPDDLARAITNSLGEGAYALDVEGRVTFANPSCQRLLGYIEAELLGQDMHQLIHFQHADGSPFLAEQCPLTGVIRSGVTIQQDTDVFTRKDGSLLPVAYTSAPIVSNGAITGAVLTFHDITDRLRSEALQRTLLAREQQARADAEAAQSRLAFLAEASIVLASSLDYNATIASVVRLAVPRLADFCYVDVVDELGNVIRLDVVHVNPDKERVLRTMRHDVPLTPDHPISQVIRTGKPQIVTDIPAGLLTKASPDQHVLRSMRALGMKSYIAMPIQSRERLLGVLMLVTAESGRIYDAADLALADELARRTALAIENARLYQRMEAALTELEVIAGERRRQAAELNAIIEAMPDGLFVCDTNGQLLRVSEHGAAMLGITVSETLRSFQEIGEQAVLRYPDGSLMPPEDYPLAQALRGVVRTDFQMLIRQRNSGRDIHLLTSFAPIRDAGGTITGAVAVGGDVTEVYRLERQKDEFLSIASHELKTPLTTLKILTQLTHRRLNRAGLFETEQTARMERAIGRMERLVNDLLDASRIESGKLALNREPTDLVALCRQIAEEQHAATGRTIELDLPSAPVEASADGERIGQVLTNLLSNALKYSPATSSVSLQLLLEGTLARVCVRDAGPGIPAEALPRLFERFYRVPGVQVQSGSGVGLGLGLYISRDIVTRHGGRMWAESQARAGAAFCFTLPLPS